MPIRWSPREHLLLILYFLKWLLLAGVSAALIGVACAAFLWSLDRVTLIRWQHPWLLWLLPVGGVGVGLLYHFFGKGSDKGNNLLMEQIHEPGGGVPARMAPLVLVGTLVTHLLGGSAGREGTAVQMGGSIAGTIGRLLRLSRPDVRTLLMVGIAAGFGAVFGTPLAGAVFALEVLAFGKMTYESLIPCLIGGIVGDRVCLAFLSRWDVHHTIYTVAAFAQPHIGDATAELSGLLAAKVALAAAAFGLASVLFAEMTHGAHWVFQKLIRQPWLRPAAGGLIVIGLTWLLGTSDYLGLGVHADPASPAGVSILSCFNAGGATNWSWWWKILFTAVTLGAGFKGGEVTPLFFVGAALGNVLARMLHAPVDLFAALGFVAVFAGATNTPLACTIMGVELFAPASGGLIGSGFVVYLSIACFLAYLMSGHSGIYLSQRIGTAKYRSALESAAGKTLLQTREARRSLFRWRN